MSHPPFHTLQIVFGPLGTRKRGEPLSVLMGCPHFVFELEKTQFSKISRNSGRLGNCEALCFLDMFTPRTDNMLWKRQPTRAASWQPRPHPTLTLLLCPRRVCALQVPKLQVFRKSFGRGHPLAPQNEYRRGVLLLRCRRRNADVLSTSRQCRTLASISRDKIR